MTPERIAELRDEYAGKCSPHRHHCNRGGWAWMTLDILELLDAIESAQQEIADLKRGGVVVDREEFDLLRKIEEMRLPPFGVPHNPESIALFDALDALRAQPTQEPAKAQIIGSCCGCARVGVCGQGDFFSGRCSARKEGKS